MQNLSGENEFYLHDNKKSFSQERFCTWPRFKTEACGISEMAYSTFANLAKGSSDDVIHTEYFTANRELLKKTDSPIHAQ